MRRHFDSAVTRLANPWSADVFFAVDGVTEFASRRKLLIPDIEPDSVAD
jgi:hypothetical protein